MHVCCHSLPSFTVTNGLLQHKIFYDLCDCFSTKCQHCQGVRKPCTQGLGFFFLLCVQWQRFWFKMKKGFVLEGETIYSHKAQVVQCVECHRPCPIQLSSPSTWWWRSCLLALSESGTIMRFSEARLEPIALSRHFQRYFKGNLDTHTCHELLCRLEAERYNFKGQCLKVDVLTVNKYLKGLCRFFFVYMKWYTLKTCPLSPNWQAGVWERTVFFTGELKIW